MTSPRSTRSVDRPMTSTPRPRHIVHWLLLSSLSAVVDARGSSPFSFTRRQNTDTQQWVPPSRHTREWCLYLEDGYHADHLALPPCSGFYRCEGGQLTGLFPCPEGLHYSEDRRDCTPFNESSCSVPRYPGGEPLPRAGIMGDSDPVLGDGGNNFVAGGKRMLMQRIFKGVEMDYRQGKPPQKAGQPGPWMEVNALLAFQRRNLDPRGALTSWNASRARLSKAGPKAVCWWYGITCDKKSGRITVINLKNIDDARLSRNRSLYGDPKVGQSLPPEFGNLTELQLLDLSYNYDTTYFVGGLVGSIPSEIGRLSRLTMLNLRFNSFDGTIPASLGNLTMLQVLDLKYNGFSGSIPASLGSLAALTSIGVSENFLNGTLPAELGNLASMVDMGIDSNPGITGSIPEAFTKLQQLSSLNLRDLGLSGPFPTFFGSFPNLCYLSITNTQIGGSLPPSLAQMGRTGPCDFGGVFLDFSNNNLEGPIPPDMIRTLCSRKANSLASFAAPNNRLTGQIPTSLFRCKALQGVILSNNSLSGTLPSNFSASDLPVLTVLELGGNQLTGPLPSSIWDLSSLYLLNVTSNRLAGNVPPFNCSSTQYNTLDLSNNQFVGDLAGPNRLLNRQFFSCMDYLSFFFVSGNRLSGTIPGELMSLPGGPEQQLTVDLHGNLFEGPMPAPPPGVNCSGLQLLDISSNAFSGGIPDALSKCTLLSWLKAESNSLSGAITSSLSALSGLQRLELGSNKLGFPIPPTLFDGLEALSILDLSGNSLVDTVPLQVTNLRQLASVDLSHNQLTGTLPSELTKLVLLSELNVGSNQFSGEVPSVLVPANLPNIFALDLSANAFSGNIPFGFANLSGYPGLQLNLSHNNFSGRVPGDLAMKPELVQNNTDLCGGAGYPECSDPASGGSLSAGAIAGIAVGAVVAALTMVGLAWWVLRPKDEWSGGTMLVFERLDFQFTGKDLLEATDNFGEKHLLGAGGFGAVYKATLQDGREVAIKRLKEGSTQGDKEFEAEITSLGNIRHRNLVVLVAAYIAPPPSKERVLLYDFMSGGSLDHILDKEMDEDSPFRQWDVRLNIALDVARGLQYLHHDCQPRIIHRDMKPANVLLDEHLNSKVADFGLARQADASKSHMSTAVYGTVGYLAIEYVRDGRLSFKSDVFAYGVTLLQIITGRKPTDKEVSERGLSRWVGAQSTDQVVDPRMDVGEKEMEQIKGAIKLGLLCTSKVPVDRPNMSEVYHLLGHLEDFAADL